MKKNLVLCAMLSMLVWTGAVKAVAATELARINTTVITLEDFNKKYRDNLKFFQYRMPTKKGVLDDIVKRELGVQEAKREGLDRDPAIIDQMNTVLYQALINHKLAKDFDAIHVTDEEAKEYYSKYPEIRTSHIFVAVPPNAKADDVAKARARLQKIKDTVTEGKIGFAEAAQKYSEGTTAPMGGDLDYQTKDKLDPIYYDAALKLRSPGKMTDIIRTAVGFHVVKLTAIRPWEDTDKAQIKRLVFDERRAQIFDKYMNKLKSQAKVSVHSELLKD